MEARSFVAPSTVWRGRAYPLGATWDGGGVNFALFSKHAERVELCLFDPRGRREVERVEVRERTDFVWHCYLPDARPGQLYAYRVHGTDEGEHRFDASRLLLDPYAKLIQGKLSAGLGRSQVVDTAFSWGEDRAPRTPWQDTVIYELHVKGFTQRHPEVPEQLRGTYAGLASLPVIEYLKGLGVTTVELLPVQAFVDERRLLQHGLRNYWGYNTIGFFAPEMRYSASGTLGEFKTMVKALHAAGLEVVLDVVYNHTGEGDHGGPTLSFRGLDNSIYYRLDPSNPRRYLNFTGTGNSFNTSHRVVLGLVMDSLRYWVQEMHVDGFRFDLASTLARNSTQAFDRNGAFLSAIRQDPVLSRVKLIAEPWDLGHDGYQLGNFPPGWVEWNDKYRSGVRSFWRGDAGTVGELASRLTGSSDIFQRAGRSPRSSVNFVTSHDGFTLEDLVSYERKHNEANGEGNRDGSDDNRSANYGAEGATQDAAVLAVRARQKRNLLATLLFSQGPPMLTAGDELGRTQQGNNNAYCQDSEVSWLDWEAVDRDLQAFVRQLIALRKRHPGFRRRSYPKPEDVIWLTTAGTPMQHDDWTRAEARTLGLLLLGKQLAERDDRGKPVEDDDLLLLLHAGDAPIEFKLPDDGWHLVLDTAAPGRAHVPNAANPYYLQPRTLALLVKAR
ncbi:MAG: glycogen debranching protein GlgX [Betaproteobacteria bacterium]|nr:glycogen debranching protein GlgX [Betaproteobacteria bacterium]MBV9360527.1 glycogen debranching protein GlgX [Betaproteobacteria bacterium]